jgi:hypothetical protein
MMTTWNSYLGEKSATLIANARQNDEADAA